MPQRMLEAHVRELAKLTANEDLRTIRSVWLGSPAQSPEELKDRKAVLKDLEIQAEGEEARKERKQGQRASANPHALSAMGIGMEVVKAPDSGDTTGEKKLTPAEIWQAAMEQVRKAKEARAGQQ